MNNNNLKFFIGFVLFLGVIVIAGELFYNLFGNKSSTIDSSITSISPLPSTFPMEFLKLYTERGDKYMFMSAEDFENGVNPEEIRIENGEQLEFNNGEVAPEEEIAPDF